MSHFKPTVLIPSYNTGGNLLCSTLRDVLEHAEIPVMVVIDGSTDGSDVALEKALGEHPQLRILRCEVNRGKGEVLKYAAQVLLDEGYTHILTMDSDGQHPGKRMAAMLSEAEQGENILVMGKPVFGAEAPLARVLGRRLTSLWTDIETLFCGLGDTLFGMRVYPLKPFLKAFSQTSFARGFDFDPEIAVRMTWLGCRPKQVSVPVRYLSEEEEGVSHFHYLRDNLKLIWLHFRLVPELLVLRLVPFIKHLRRWKNAS